jgi:hypothetical protein
LVVNWPVTFCTLGGSSERKKPPSVRLSPKKMVWVNGESAGPAKAGAAASAIAAVSRGPAEGGFHGESSVDRVGCAGVPANGRRRRHTTANGG